MAPEVLIIGIDPGETGTHAFWNGRYIGNVLHLVIETPSQSTTTGRENNFAIAANTFSIPVTFDPLDSGPRKLIHGSWIPFGAWQTHCSQPPPPVPVVPVGRGSRRALDASPKLKLPSRANPRWSSLRWKAKT